MLPLLKSPHVIIALLCATTAAFAIGFIESLLELHLEKFSLSINSIGLCFLAMSATYTASTIATGWITDMRFRPWSICSFGLLLILIAFLLIGPLPFLPLPPSLSLTIMGLVLQGSGSAAVLVSSYSCSITSTLKIDGYGEGLATYSIVSGVWTSAFALGNFLGPTVAGVLFDQVCKSISRKFKVDFLRSASLGVVFQWFCWQG